MKRRPDSEAPAAARLAKLLASLSSSRPLIAAGSRRLLEAEIFHAFQPIAPSAGKTCRSLVQVAALRAVRRESPPVAFLPSQIEERTHIDVIDLFSGCGGMSAGFAAVNHLHPFFNLLAAVDVDRVANDTYRANLGLVPTEADVADVSLLLARTAKDSLPTRRRQKPLIMIGCAPCQGFSSHRNVAGFDDERNSLILRFAEIASFVKPEAIIMENVPELLTGRYWPYVERARGLLNASGYSTYVGVHNMAEYGVPQERYRAVIIAMAGAFTPPAGFLTPTEFMTVRTAIQEMAPLRPGETSSKDPMHRTVEHRESTIRTIKAVPLDGGNRPKHVGPECLRRAHVRQGRGMYDDVYGRLAWDKPSITITAYARNPASGRFVHPEQDRGLSIREAALLQGFPMDYLFSGTLDDAFRQIGNAVPPTFATCLALHVLGELATARINFDQPVNFGQTNPMRSSFSRMIASLKARNIAKTATA